MSAVLDLVYSLAVGLVAIVGVAWVLASTDDGTGRDTTWSRWTSITAIALFLVVLVWVMAVQPLL